MLGRQHATSGLAVGLHAAPLFIDAGEPVPVRIAQAVLVAAFVAGGAILPDLDHPGASASRMLGWLTGALCHALRALSVAAYRATCTPADPKVDGAHRGLTHTLGFAVAVGALVTVGCNAWPVWGALVAAVLVVLFAEEGIPGDWLLPLAGGAAFVWLAAVPDPSAALADVSPWLGVCVAAGCVVHLLGDAATESGVPLLAPFVKIDGQRWYRVGPPKLLRFPAGGACELLIVWPLLLAASALGAPGAWDVLDVVWRALPEGTGWIAAAVLLAGVGVRAAWLWDDYESRRSAGRRNTRAWGWSDRKRGRARARA